MMVKEEALLAAAVGTLRARLPPSWTVDVRPPSEGGDGSDLLLTSPNAGSEAVILVDARTVVSPRDIELLIGGPWRRWRRQPGTHPLMLVAPYIGARARQLLQEENVSYVDLTGNVWISLDHPGVFVTAEGADRDPTQRPRAALRGAKAGAVVRTLVDAAPPYAGAEVARAAGVNEGYLSRILDTLIDEALIDRTRGGGITDVDWAALIRRRAQNLDLFKRRQASRFVARRGADDVLATLRARAPERRAPTVTGSFAAVRVAPVAAPSLLVVYTIDPRQLERELDLLPADAGADTVLVRPDNDAPFTRATPEGGLAWAAPSQVAIDSLSGTGRMPAEGEALIEWMRANESEWRYGSITALLAASDPSKV